MVVTQSSHVTTSCNVGIVAFLKRHYHAECGYWRYDMVTELVELCNWYFGRSSDAFVITDFALVWTCESNFSWWRCIVYKSTISESTSQGKIKSLLDSHVRCERRSCRNQWKWLLLLMHFVRLLLRYWNGTTCCQRGDALRLTYVTWFGMMMESRCLCSSVPLACCGRIWIACANTGMLAFTVCLLTLQMSSPTRLSSGLTLNMLITSGM